VSKLNRGKDDRLATEVSPRLEASSSLLAHGLLGTLDLSQAAEGALALADNAARHVEVELAERALRGATK
jgi:hypothetical protein